MRVTIAISFYDEQEIQRVFNLPIMRQQSWDPDWSVSYLHFSALFT